FQVRIDLGDLAPDLDADISGAGLGIDLASTEQETTVQRLAEVTDDEARIIDAFAAGQNRAARPERRRGTDERADGHNVAGRLGLQPFDVTAGGKQAVFGGDRAALGGDFDLAAVGHDL